MNDSTRPPLVYKPLNKVRFVTAASLFDGHDASINIMRRILQATGCEVIHLGHNRSVEEIVTCALQEDAHGIAISSTERLWPRWITSQPVAWRIRRMMLIDASCPSKSEAAVTKRTLFRGL